MVFGIAGIAEYSRLARHDTEDPQAGLAELILRVALRRDSPP